MSDGIARPGRVHEITSTANPIIKDMRRLAQKRHREETGLFLCEGLKLARDALAAGWPIATLIYAKESKGDEAVSRLAARVVASGGDVLEVSRRVLTTVLRRDNPAGVAAVVRRRLVALGDVRATGEDVWVALDRVRDPGNLGTVLRTADAVGASGVILIGDTVDPFGLEAVRATMGSLFALPLVRASEEEFLGWRPSWTGQVVGTHLEGATDYRTIRYAGAPQLIIMGNEQRGLSDALAAACDALALIPQAPRRAAAEGTVGAGGADSLNLAVATGVMLFEVRRHALGKERTFEKERPLNAPTASGESA